VNTKNAARIEQARARVRTNWGAGLARLGEDLAAALVSHELIAEIAATDIDGMTDAQKLAVLNNILSLTDEYVGNGESVASWSRRTEPTICHK
jgi:hypothetical protein